MTGDQHPCMPVGSLSKGQTPLSDQLSSAAWPVSACSSCAALCCRLFDEPLKGDQSPCTPPPPLGMHMDALSPEYMPPTVLHADEGWADVAPTQMDCELHLDDEALLPLPSALDLMSHQLPDGGRPQGLPLPATLDFMSWDGSDRPQGLPQLGTLDLMGQDFDPTGGLPHGQPQSAGQGQSGAAARQAMPCRLEEDTGPATSQQRQPCCSEAQQARGTLIPAGTRPPAPAVGSQLACVPPGSLRQHRWADGEMIGVAEERTASSSSAPAANCGTAAVFEGMQVVLDPELAADEAER